MFLFDYTFSFERKSIWIIVIIISILFIYYQIRFRKNQYLSKDPLTNLLHTSFNSINKTDNLYYVLEYSLKYKLTKNAKLTLLKNDRCTFWVNGHKPFTIDTFFKKKYDQKTVANGLDKNIGKIAKGLYKNIGKILDQNKNIPLTQLGFSCEISPKNTNYRVYMNKLFSKKKKRLCSVRFNQGSSEFKEGEYHFYQSCNDLGDKSLYDIIKNNINDHTQLLFINQLIDEHIDKPIFLKMEKNRIIGVDFIFIPNKRFSDLCKIQWFNNISEVPKEYNKEFIKHLQICFDEEPTITFYYTF